MKRKTIATIVLATCIIVRPAMANENADYAMECEQYPDCGMVTEVKYTEANLLTVTITMQNGKQFAFLDDEEDWLIGDLAAVTINSNGTLEVYDDEIIDARYVGWTDVTTWVKVK